MAARLLFVALCLVSIAAALPHETVHACATASRSGVVVRIADEEALIVWNAATKTEHFVRHATFVSDADDFGFLVPTPNRPELAETESDVFSWELPRFLQPDLIKKEGAWSIDPMPLLFYPFMRSLGTEKSASVGGPKGAVQVLETARVAGYDATVLEASDAGALASWLTERGYAESTGLKEWLEPYVVDHWTITAFKIAKDKNQRATGRLGSASVRMTFKAEKPFFPYREPAEQRDAAADTPAKNADPSKSRRLLRVYYVSDERAQATVGPTNEWAATVKYAGPLNLTLPFDAAPSVPPQPWLTIFEDEQSPRPGVDEVYFAPSSDASMVKPPPRIEYVRRKIPLPLDVVGLLVAGGVYLGVRNSRSKKGR